MPTRNLDRLFDPRSIAVIGASERAGSIGATLVSNLLAHGFAGPVYPVNPKYHQVQGLPAFRSVAELPQPPDLALVAIPAAGVAEVIDQLGRLGTRAAVVIAAGYRETGASGKALEEQLEAARAKHPGFRILGPNCLGFLAPGRKLSASFAHGLPESGRVAFVSQSGALCTAILDWAIAKGIGFSYFVSLGNALDVGFADVIDYLAVDPRTESLVLYIESISRARQFMSAARAFTRRKPIIVYKAGRYAQSAEAAASHTGALAGMDAAYEAAFRRAAIVRVNDSEQIFDCAEVLARCPLPGANRLGIVTNAGGPGVMATDTLIEGRGQLAPLTPGTLLKLNHLLPSSWSHRNPVDVLGDAPPDRFARACELVLRDEQVDGLVAILTPQAMTEPTETARQFARGVAKARKPVLAAWMGSRSVAEARDLLNQRGIPTLHTPEQAVRSFLHLTAYARNLQTLYETPRAVPLPFGASKQQRRVAISQALARGRVTLTESASKSVLAVYQIPVIQTLEARSLSQAEECAAAIGYPLVMKVLSPDVTHKTDVHGVQLNLQSIDDVRRAYQQILDCVRRARPDAVIEGVTLQRYVAAPYGLELILGSRRDPVLGPVMMIGLGGIATELHRDCSFELPPLDERLARRMLEQLRCWPLLSGYRGRPPLAVEALIETVLRFSTLIVEVSELVECDVNPVVVTPEEVVAVDARLVLDPAQATPPERPFAHLAIAPYPEDYVQPATLKDGTSVVIRPIRPEDEPLWHEMLDAASDESIWSRFRSSHRGGVHRQAGRYCFVDYDREMALVAEARIDHSVKLIGVGRLVVDQDRQAAEFAVLVVDAWQNRGLGGLLLDACIRYGEAIGLDRIYAETNWDNRRMIRLFRSRGFELRHGSSDPTTLFASRNLCAQ
jgi:acetyltransferase